MPVEVLEVYLGTREGSLHRFTPLDSVMGM
jgi:hypothetical protein